MSDAIPEKFMTAARGLARAVEDCLTSRNTVSVLGEDRIARALMAAAKEADEAATMRESGQYGWLAELKGANPRWAFLNPMDYDEHWTTDASKALRFARREDAQAFIDHSGWTSVFPTEHVWDDGKSALKGEA